MDLPHTAAADLPMQEYFQGEAISAQIVDALPSALVVIDAQGVVRVWNHAAEEMSGYKREEVVGANITRLFPEHKRWIATLWARVRRKRHINRAEAELRNANDQRMAIGFSVALLEDEEERPQGVVIIARGLNEQKRYDTLMSALDSSSKSVALAHSPDNVYNAMGIELRKLGLWTLVLLLESDSDKLNLRHVDIEHLLGAMDCAVLTDSEILQHLAPFSVPTDAIPEFDRLLRTGRPFLVSDFLLKLEIAFPEPIDGYLNHIVEVLGYRDAVMAPLWKEGQIAGGVFVGGLLSPDDVAPIGAFANQLSSALANADLWLSLEERVSQRTARLQQEQERQNAILNNMTDAVVFTDTAGRIVFTNPAWERLHGYKIDAVEGKVLTELLTERRRTNVRAEILQHIREGRMWRGEVYVQRYDGSFYDGDLTLVPVHDDTNTLRNFVGVERDITDEKELMLAKDRFVSDMSHELRTPLTNIKFYISLLERGKVERRARYMETLKRETSRLQNLIEDLLTLSRLDQERIEFYLQPVDLNSFLGNLVTDREPMMSTQGLKASFAPDPDLPQVMADPSLLEQVAGNLLTNAINYTPQGGLVTVRTMGSDRNDRLFCHRYRLWDQCRGADPAL